MAARDIQVNGIVQGVGFRPFVARLAHELGLGGWVANDVDGVRIHVEHADGATLDAFETRLQAEAPVAARIVSFASKAGVEKGAADFVIRRSERHGTRDTLVSPDLATCPDCLAELFDPDDARYHYPFINCTNCGPRFTIIDDLPYDRAVTSMRGFAMCPRCQAEYDDETDRRYHAQPNACFTCGPRLWWVDAGSASSDALEFDAEGALVPDRAHLAREESDALVERAARVLEHGAVLAVKGLGGWHLACDATDEHAVAALRKRKRRPTKPLAVMVRDLAAARALGVVGAAEERLLTGRTRPIVLLQRAADGPLAANVAGELPEVGVMLPSTPLQHLLLAATDRPLVMTSGNRSGEPIVARDDEAIETLGAIADAFLGNNRAIVARYDDSVVRVLEDGSEQMVRRARGLAPAPLFLDGPRVEERVGCVFAAGPEQKATFAYLEGRRVYLSQHLGDLEHLGAWRAWDEARRRYARLFDLTPDAMAADLHPEYLASKWARETADEKGMRLIEVQHHHAHIAAVLGENGLDGPVIGVALDGTGFGEDGTIWGGEVLVATRAGFERFWHLPAFPLPGGAAAIRNPLRTAHALLRTAAASDDPFLAPFAQDDARFTASLEALEGRELIDQMIDRHLNSPLCSSAGRLFDAVAALLGICTQPGYDGEAACLLEAAARRELASRGLGIRQWAQLQDDAAAAGPLTALSFHRHVIEAIIEQCERARDVHHIDKVALGGGCMVNRLVSQGLKEGLRRRGFSVYVNRELPPNDGCIAYGQVIVARARILED